MKTYSEFKEIVTNYQKYFDRCGLTAGILYDLQSGYQITETTTHYSGRKVTDQKTIVISAEYLANAVSAIGFFGDRVSRAYCHAGYIVDELKCKCPYSNERIKRQYHYEKVK